MKNKFRKSKFDNNNNNNNNNNNETFFNTIKSNSVC